MSVNYKDLRPNSTPKNIRFNNDLLSSINSARGDKPFSEFVCEALREKLSIKKAPANKRRKIKQETDKSIYPNMPRKVNEAMYDKIKELTSNGKNPRQVFEITGICRSSIMRALSFDEFPK